MSFGFVQNSSDEAARWRPERGYRDKRKERRPYAEYSLPCVFMKSVWSRHLISISTTSIKNDLLALRHSGRAWILQPECSLLYGHNWPCGPFHTHSHTEKHTHTDRQTTAVEKCLGDLWKTWKIHFNNTSNTETLITGPLKGFTFHYAVYFLDKTPSSKWLKQAGDTAANHKHKLHNHPHKCTSHASGSKSWFDLNSFLRGVSVLALLNMEWVCVGAVSLTTNMFLKYLFFTWVW